MPIPDFSACRTLGHAWDTHWTRPDEAPSSASFVLARFRCSRCATERTDTVNKHSGEVEGRRYRYPDGYRKTGTGPAPRRSEWRKMFFQITTMKAKVKVK